MNRFFNLDNPFFVFMGRVADLFILNVVFVLCCIPVVTIGPAITAMFYVTLKMAKNEESYILRSFFHSFKQNLRQGIVINLILMFIGALLLGDFYLTARMTVSYIQVVRVLLMVVTVFYFLEYLYVYPVLAKFDNTIKNTFRNSILMAIRHLPQTVIMTAIALSPLLLLLIKDAATQSTVMFIMVLLGPATIAYGNSIFFMKVFSRYIPEEEPVPEFSGSNPDFGIYESVSTVDQNAAPDIFAQLREENTTKEIEKSEEEQN